MERAMLGRDEILRLMDEMIGHQRRKVLEMARESVPGMTEEDLRNPQDFPVLVENARFNFEDGILAGYISTRMALLTDLSHKEER